MASETADFPLATRAAFLDYLREKCAYDGGDTIEDVQKFLKDRDESGSPIELVGDDDKPIDLGQPTPAALSLIQSEPTAPPKAAGGLATKDWTDEQLAIARRIAEAALHA